MLWQVILRLPPKFHGKWADFCFTFRRMNTCRIWNRLQDISPSKPKHELKKNRDTEERYVDTKLMRNKCILCDNQHRFFKCNKYKSVIGSVWQRRRTYVSTAWRVAITHSLVHHQTIVSNKIKERASLSMKLIWEFPALGTRCLKQKVHLSFQWRSSTCLLRSILDYSLSVIWRIGS